MDNLSIEKPRYFIHSLNKGLQLLQCMAKAGKPLTISEIAELMNSNSATVTRFCYTLTTLGFLQRGVQRRYRLTPKILTLGYPAVCKLEWQDIAQYYMQQLSDEIQTTVNLTILDGSEILFVRRIKHTDYLPYDIGVGTKLPVYCTASGKILMALSSPEKTAPILKNLKFSSSTPHTIMTMDGFLRELDEVRKKRYAVNDQELSTLIRTVGAPIFDRQGYAIGAIGASFPTFSFSREEVEEKFAPKVVQKANKITDAISKMDLNEV